MILEAFFFDRVIRGAGTRSEPRAGAANKHALPKIARHGQKFVVLMSQSLKKLTLTWHRKKKSLF
jgi:hypothetical protein